MRKLILSVIMAFAVTLGLFTAPAWAAQTITASRLSMEVSKSTVNSGETVTISGTLEGQEDGSAWVPLASKNVTLEIAVPGQDPVWEQTTTDASGRYQFTRTMGGTLTFQAHFADEAGVIPRADSEERKVTVLNKVFVTIGSLTYDPYGELIVHGSYGDDSANSNWNPTLRLEYSPNGRSNWKLAKNISGSDQNFYKKFFWSTSGYWRVRYPGDSERQEGISSVRKAWRWATYINKYRVTPKKLRKNRKVKVSGKLNRYFSMSRKGAYKNQKVLIIFRFKGGKKWYLAGSDKTNSKGKFSKRVRAYGDSYFVALFEGGKDTFASDTRKIYVNTYGSGRGAGQQTALIPWLKALPGVTGQSPARFG